MCKKNSKYCDNLQVPVLQCVVIEEEKTNFPIAYGGDGVVRWCV